MNGVHCEQCGCGECHCEVSRQLQINRKSRKSRCQGKYHAEHVKILRLRVRTVPSSGDRTSFVAGGNNSCAQVDQDACGPKRPMRTEQPPPKYQPRGRDSLRSGRYHPRRNHCLSCSHRQSTSARIEQHRQFPSASSDVAATCAILRSVGWRAANVCAYPALSRLFVLEWTIATRKSTSAIYEYHSC